MGLLDTIRSNAPAAATTAPTIPGATPALDPQAADREARRARVAAETAALEAEEKAEAEAKEIAARAAVAAAEALKVAAPTGTGVLPTDAPVSGTTGPTAEALPAGASAPEAAPTEGAKKKRGRPAGSKNAAAPAEGALVLYVNCPTLEGVDASDLDDYIAEITTALETKYNVSDVRFSEGTPLDFGKWEGAVAAVAKANAPKGAWFVNDTSDSKLRQIVVAALKPLAAVFVRGAR